MEHFEELLEELVCYYMRTRAVGHTYCTINGMKSNDKCKIVAVSEAHKQTLNHSGVNKKNILTLQDFKNGKTRRVVAPIVFDNYTLDELFRITLRNIKQLKEDK